MKVDNHPYVESYWVEELPNGVIHLLINCKDRGFDYWMLNDYQIVIAKNEDEMHGDISMGYDRLKLTIPEFLPYDSDDLMYIVSVSIEDEQLSFYYIPYYKKEWIKNRKFIIK